MIEQAAVISLIVLFIYMCFRETMIFGFINKWFKTWLPEVLWKSVFDCPVCMTPYYGTIIYFILYNFGIKDWIFTIFVAAGMSCLYDYLYNIVSNTNPDKQE